MTLTSIFEMTLQYCEEIEHNHPDLTPVEVLKVAENRLRNYPVKDETDQQRINRWDAAGIVSNALRRRKVNTI